VWIFAWTGFYSIASAQKSDGSMDPQMVMVRARCKRHLQNLVVKFPALSGEKIITFPNRDYRYRIIVPKAVWVGVLSELAQEQTWSNFKHEVARRQGKVGREYVAALHEVWRVMSALQRS
jgi:hypothetical protein